MTLYLDSCCVSRPFDDQTDPRVHLESEAILIILTLLERGNWRWVGSEVLQEEISRIKNNEKRLKTLLVAQFIAEWVPLDDPIIRRGQELQAMGFGGYDALHLASAEAARTDVFLSTDGRLVRRAQRLRTEIDLTVRNPLAWLQEIEQS